MTDDRTLAASNGLSPKVILDADEVARRIIDPSQFMADTEAFIDVRIPGSEGKASYSFIGPGVSQNADQKINLTEPHGFNVGAASMPNGVVNNPHMHYTAEVFVCTRGRWEMRIGQRGEQTIDIGSGDVFSAPNWVFRGFTNTGDDDGWLFVVLGGDDTGGILWAPQVLEAAAATGMYLSTDYALVDETAGQPIDGTLAPIDQARLDELDQYSDAELQDRLVPSAELAWSRSALLSSLLPDRGSALAPVIGFGMSEDRQQRPPIRSPHGFTLEWLRLDPGADTGLHRFDVAQTLLIVDGSWEVGYNTASDHLARPVSEGSVVSVPAGAWRRFANTSDGDAHCLVVCAGDSRKRIEWDPTILAAVTELGFGRDANGYRAPLDLIARPAQ